MRRERQFLSENGRSHLTQHELTTGSIALAYEGTKPVSEFVCQVLSVKKVSSAQGDRYRLVVSDGVHYMQGIYG
jgi:hypothetical protein